MKISYNELVLTSRKALESLGWAQGDWEDGADAVAWLELHNLNGVQQLVAALDMLNAPYQQPLKRSNNLFDAVGQHCLAVGALVIDSCYADSAENGWASATVLNCHGQQFLLAYLLRCAQRDRLVIASWQDGAAPDTAWQVRIAPNAAYPRLNQYKLSEPSPLQNGLHLLIAADAEFELPTPAGVLVEEISAEFPQRAEANLRNGIVVNDEAWRTLQELAKGILVPETEASRQRGAGESGGA